MVITPMTPQVLHGQYRQWFALRVRCVRQVLRVAIIATSVHIPTQSRKVAWGA